MKKATTLSVGLCFLLSACAGLNQQNDTVDIQESEIREPYPYSEVVAVYEAVLDGMTGKYFAEYPDLDQEHTAKLKSFIRSEYSSEKFVQQIVTDKYIAVFDRAKEDEAYRDTKEFKDSFAVMVNVSVPMAQMIIGGLRDIYVSKYIEKDPIKTELFENSDPDHWQYISWVQGEVTAEEFLKNVAGDLGIEGVEEFRAAGEDEHETREGDQPSKTVALDHDIRDGDRFFLFSSPPSTWANLCGREGFLHVRDKKIINVIITSMN